MPLAVMAHGLTQSAQTNWLIMTENEPRRDLAIECARAHA